MNVEAQLHNLGLGKLPRQLDPSEANPMSLREQVRPHVRMVIRAGSSSPRETIYGESIEDRNELAAAVKAENGSFGYPPEAPDYGSTSGLKDYLDSVQKRLKRPVTVK